MISKTIMARPAEDEYGPFYRAYISLVPHQDLIETLKAQKDTTARMLKTISEDKAGMRYAPDKWSIKEVVGHLCDTERIMTYRGLRIARGDQTPLPGFEQDDYVRQAGFDLRRDRRSDLRNSGRFGMQLFHGFEVSTARRFRGEVPPIIWASVFWPSLILSQATNVTMSGYFVNVTSRSCNAVNPMHALAKSSRSQTGKGSSKKNSLQCNLSGEAILHQEEERGWVLKLAIQNREIDS